MANALLELSNGIRQIVEGTARRVVGVHGRNGRPSSGIVVGPGVAVTADETIDRDENIELTLPDGSRTAATLVGRDPTTDIAVLRFAGALAGQDLEDADAVSAGALIFAVGRSGAASLSAMGTVALAGEPWRSSQGGEIDAFLRIDVSLSGAGEGGALVDAAGRLVGMAVFGPRRRVLAIPAKTIRRVSGQILANGSIGRGYVGLGVEPVRLPAGEDDKQAASRGAIVVSVDASGPGKAAGVILGDILVTWNGDAIGGPRGLVNRLGPDSVGRTVALGIVRAGSGQNLALTVGERPKT